MKKEYIKPAISIVYMDMEQDVFLTFSLESGGTINGDSDFTLGEWEF